MKQQHYCTCKDCREIREAEALAAIDRRIRRERLRDVAGSIALAVWVAACVFVWAKWL
jgi:hypothetical protein